MQSDSNESTRHYQPVPEDEREQLLRLATGLDEYVRDSDDYVDLVCDFLDGKTFTGRHVRSVDALIAAASASTAPAAAAAAAAGFSPITAPASASATTTAAVAVARGASSGRQSPQMRGESGPTPAASRSQSRLSMSSSSRGARNAEDRVVDYLDRLEFRRPPVPTPIEEEARKSLVEANTRKARADADRAELELQRARLEMEGRAQREQMRREEELLAHQIRMRELRAQLERDAPSAASTPPLVRSDAGDDDQ